MEMLGPTPPELFEGDGCTWAPDGWGGIYFGEACRYHDWLHYTHATSRWTCDWLFWKNLRRLGCPRRLAFIYWLGVRVGGGFYWRQHTNCRPDAGGHREMAMGREDKEHGNKHDTNDTRVYSTTLLIDRDSEDGDPLGRCDMLLSMEVSTEDQPFCSFEFRYFDVPAKMADAIQTTVNRLSPRELPATMPLSYSDLVKLEGKFVKMLKSLNKLGQAYIGKSRKEKRDVDDAFISEFDDSLL